MKERVLLVDDDQNVLDGYRRNLRANFVVYTASGAAEAIELIKTSDPFAVVVSDFKMPEMDGVKFISVVQKISPDTVRIILTGYAELQMAIDAVNEGNVFRFLTKPCTPDKLIHSINAGIEQYRLVTAERELLDQTLRGSIKLLTDLLSIVSPLVFSQVTMLTDMTKRIAQKMNYPRLWEIEIATLLSQIGCIAIPTEILEKRFNGESLTESEEKLFSTHPGIGSGLLKNIPRLEDIAEAIYYQNKNYNGEGGDKNDLIGDNIPVIGRILKAVNDYDYFLKTKKSNKEAFDALKNIAEQYDPVIMDILQTEIAGMNSGFTLKSIYLDELKAGMVLAKEIRDEYGVLIISKGSEISEILRIRLLNFAKTRKIVEPIIIYEPIK